MASNIKKTEAQGAFAESSKVLETAARALEAALADAPSHQDILGIEDAARLMRCSVDTLRRIPEDDLPIYRVGRENLYFREEVLRFVRSRRVRDVSGAVEAVVDDVLMELEGRIPGVVDSESIDGRKRSSRRTP